jgi:peptidoglycan/LPS O-acetylase OafA/YrhL
MTTTQPQVAQIASIEHAETPRLDRLTGLRGLLAIWVMLCHITVGLVASGCPVADLLGHRWMRGLLAADIAVYCFFLLSGFLLARLYTGRLSWAAGRRRSLVAFWGLRLAKIYPLHVLVLLAYALVTWLDLGLVVTGLGHPLHPQEGARFPAGQVVDHLLLVSAWGVGAIPTWNPVAWSISAEWAAYLCLPLLLPLTARLRPGIAPLLLASACAAGGIALLAACGRLSTDPAFRQPDYGLLGVACFFPAGMLVERCCRDPGSDRMPWERISPAIATAIAVLLLTPWCYWSVTLMPLLIAALARSRPRTLDILATRPLRWLGDLSFALYLVHVLVLECLGAAWGTQAPPDTLPELLAAMLGMAALCLGGACASYYLVERPLHQRLRRTINRWAGWSAA